ncbi:MAG: 2'-5' ligase [Dehalococcoidales bacterium]|nr:2'-5' ligase [Dehalococcoidales bacterium]
MEEIRSFIAVELPEGLQQELARLITRLKTRSFSAKWVDPASIHLTLKFLGNVAVERIDEITMAMMEATQNIAPFQLEVKELGAFPNLNRVQIVWVGISGELDKLSQLQQLLETNLSQLGFPTEARPFTPHLTLARLRDQASPEERQRLGKLIASTAFEGGIIKVESIGLIRSELTRAGAIYSRMTLAGLGGGLRLP